MKIKISEQLFLTNEESQILEEAQTLLSKIYNLCPDSGRIENLAIEAEDYISELLEISSLE